jgi:hypothetical protein
VVLKGPNTHPNAAAHAHSQRRLVDARAHGSAEAAIAVDVPQRRARLRCKCCRKLGSLAYKVTVTIDNQFICHVNYGWLGGGATYNMESWRPNIHWIIQGNPVTKCNP